MHIYTSEQKDVEITNLEEWFNYCPPKKGLEQWVDNRSAKEMAKFWLNQENHKFFLERMINLYQYYFKNNGAILDIMYQLTYWFAGSLIDAIKSDAENIIIVLEEFRSSSTNITKLDNNHKEFEKFIKLISEGKYNIIENKNMLGPMNNQYTNNKNLYIGYYSIDLNK
ncbi:hypothetical protein AGMMS50225_24210 [Betaproteobacteria bacterium]|nr:hypothetical protein AGMMS50225_24210 [Betaproteobacteria bacterium]